MAQSILKFGREKNRIAFDGNRVDSTLGRAKKTQNASTVDILAVRLALNATARLTSRARRAEYVIFLLDKRNSV